MEEYRTQQEMLDEANRKRHEEHDSKKSDPPQGTAGDLEETIKIVSTGRPVSEDRVERQRKAFEKFLEQKREQKYFDEQKKAFDKIAEQNKKETSQSSNDSYHMHMVEGGLGEREVEISFLELYTKNSSQSTGNGASVRSGHHQEPLYQNIPRNGVRYNSPVLGRTSQQHYSSNVPPPINEHHFTIGSMVVIPTQYGEPLHGVIMWIGTVPGKPGLIAGVELVSTYILVIYYCL